MEEKKLDIKDAINLNKRNRIFKKIEIEITHIPENSDIEFIELYSKKILKANKFRGE